VLTAGVDLAAEPTGTALAVIDWAAPVARVVSLEVGVPDARIVQAATGATSTGIDCAFGWPDEFVAFVQAHARGERIAPDPGGMVWRRRLAYRATDRHTRDITGRWPLSVSTDRLGLTAMHCAALLDRWGEEFGVVDRSGGGRVVEVYPGASLRLWGVDTRGYKTGSDARAAIVDGFFVAEAPWLDLSPVRSLMVADDDAFDAVVAAVAARAHALGLCLGPPAELHDQARREGWIALPPTDLTLLASGMPEPPGV
jgi:predicted nuclease with RNAse H fold